MDEGVGPACARYLATRYEFPEDVEVLDRSVMGMAILSDLRRFDFALVLDALEVPGAQAGQLFSFEPADAAPTPPGMASLHEMRFADVLSSAELLGIACAGHCFGVQVENMSPSEFVMALTPCVAAAVPLLCQAAVRYMRTELGCAVRDRAAEDDPLRAGLCVPGGRDFSATGVRGGAGRQGVPSAGEGVPGGDVTDGDGLDGEPFRMPTAPRVYGEPDASVMAEYLAKGLAAVGACPVDVDGGTNRVSFGVSMRGAEELAGRFGCDVVPGDAAGETVCLVAHVFPSTTDYDCDALIGACRELVRGASVPYDESSSKPTRR